MGPGVGAGASAGAGAYTGSGAGLALIKFRALFLLWRSLTLVDCSIGLFDAASALSSLSIIG